MFWSESLGLGQLSRFKLRKRSVDVDRAIRCVVQNAYRRTAHYRKVLDEAGLSPADIRGSGQLSLIPITTREFIGEQSWRSVLSDRAVESKCYTALTSGSTGTLLPVYMDRIEAYYRRLLLLLAFRKNLRFRLPLRIVEIGPRQKPAVDDVIQKMGIVRVVQVHLGGGLASADALLLKRFRPQILTGPPSCLELLAEQWTAAGLDGVALGLVVSRGEVLSDQTRARLQRTLQSRVVDYYSCEEVGNIAWECPDRPGCLHINADACVVEILGEDGRHVPFGEEGMVVVTNLFNYTMPFVRYVLDDQAHFMTQEGDRCTCGSTLPLMSAPSGRDEDFLILPDGSRVSPRTIDNLVGHTLYSQIHDRESLIRYRIIQETVSLIRVEAIVAGVVDQTLEQTLDAKCRQIHSDMHCRLDLVDEFPAQGSSKLRRVTSRVA
ncbi:phenylacetate--CoA ligase family protein [Candidatus Bipolaricaulota bacterium]